MNNLIDQVFEKHFSSLGSDLREEQRAVIESVLAGHNTLAIMPTGSGKSLCYWIAGLALHGTTLAIFPLTALMDEQERKLTALGCKVLNLHSGVAAEKQLRQILELRPGHMPDFIFVSPERMGNDGLLEFVLERCHAEIKLVVIDEIHCISQWGHDFRPFYQNIPPFMEAVFGASGDRPAVLGLTATLSPKDIQQVCQDFGIAAEHVLKSQYLLRYPIKLEAIRVADEPAKDILFWDRLKQHRQDKVLVYVENKRSGDRSTEGFCERAQQDGFKAAYFHGDMSSDAKAAVIQQFIAGQILTVFATSAFGMGIDIPDIRGVIHYRLPESVEQYYQQIGRVGRDGGAAWAVVYYSNKNIDFRKTQFIARSFPTREKLVETFQKLLEGKGPVQSLDYFAEEDAQTAFHYLLRHSALRVRTKSLQRIDVFEEKSPGIAGRFGEYHRATKNGLTTLVAERVHESVEQVTRDIYQWWTSGAIHPQKGRIPHKCLMVERLAPELTDALLDTIMADIEAKQQYRYGLLDQLVLILDGHTDSVALHQAIGRYLGVDKFQMDRVQQTLSGAMVRSKSEVIIANLLTKNGLAFEYETRLEADGVGFWPDFTIHLRDKTYYWEHLGRLDLEQYRQNWAIKRAWYEKNFPGQLLTTEEGVTLSQIAQGLIETQLTAPKATKRIVARDAAKAKVWTEGLTDWKHLKAAFARLKAAGEFPTLDLEFEEDDKDMGDKELLAMCRTLSRIAHPNPVFCIFDRDVPGTVKSVSDGEHDYKPWGNQIYSIALPVPAHRVDTPDICIEFLYPDQAIRQADETGRRLFIGTEFNQRTGNHESGQFNCTDRNKVGRFTIVDSQVFRIGTASDDNVALSKNQFANYVQSGDDGFGDFDLAGFRPLFRLLETLLQTE